MTDSYIAEIQAGQRFEFGKNWQQYLAEIDDIRIRAAEDATKAMLGLDSLVGKTFLDVGSGSGLFSLVALRLGASSVRSFDYDLQSVECTGALKHRYYPSHSNWIIERGSVLDSHYLNSLGQFDVVYSWGVLHHTGNMEQALHNVAPLVAPGGLLFLSIYNYQPFLSSYWKVIKRTYNRLPKVGRVPMELAFSLFFGAAFFAADVIRHKNPLERWEGRGQRGMSIHAGIQDWVGGYPFEVARPEEIFRFYRDRGFALRELTTCGGKHGCNQFVFERQIVDPCLIKHGMSLEKKPLGSGGSA
jgi:2-polyprenyl-6-hydroxyphenyl methylase/3-demethylubiquinone-9 3-methyltransferase